MTSDYRKVARYIAYILTVISCGMSAWFGAQQSHYFLAAVGMALFLGGISVLSDFAWLLVRDHRHEIGKMWSTSVVAGICFALFCNVFNLASNFGSVGFTRGVASQEAEMQNVRYDDGRQKIADLEAKKKLLESRMSKLEATKGWTGMKPSAAYDGEIEAQNLAVEVEGKRGGCKARCLAEKQKLAELEANKAVAMAHEQDRAMLTATIEGLAALRNEQATVEKGANGGQWQNVEFASFFTASLEPTETAQAWTSRWLVWGMAFMLAFGGMGAHYYGNSSPRMASGPTPPAQPHAATEKATDEASAMLRDLQALMARQASAPSASPSTHTHEKEVLVLKEDDPRAKAAYAAMGILADGARKLKVA